MKNREKKVVVKKIQTDTKPINWDNSIILLLYGFVTILTPLFQSYEANGPKFLSFSLLNAITLLYLLKIEYKKNSIDESVQLSVSANFTNR